jgi:GDPmannose 4,6-dehydratase
LGKRLEETMSKKICITGISGQVGAALTEELLNRYPDCKIYGLKRRSSSHNTERIDHLYNDPQKHSRLELAYGDLSDYSSILNFVGDVKPNYFYNCGAMSHVKVSEFIPENCMDITGAGVIRVLEAIKKSSPKTRFLQLSSSEMFGNSIGENDTKQSEITPFNPRSIYACAKVAGYYSTINYRESFNMFAANAIAFNMESEKRGPTFLTRKCTIGAAKIKLGLQDYLYLGNLEAKRDWNFVGDSIDAFIKIIEADEPDDYVVATGETYSVKHFVELVFSKLDLDWKQYVKFDERLLRKAEVNKLCGDSAKIRAKLKWEPKYTLNDIVDKMVAYDLKLAQNELLIKNNG